MQEINIALYFLQSIHSPTHFLQLCLPKRGNQLVHIYVWCRSQPNQGMKRREAHSTVTLPACVTWSKQVHIFTWETKATPSCMPCHVSTEDRLRPRRGDDGICMCGIRKDDKSVDGKANGTFQLIKGPGRAGPGGEILKAKKKRSCE